MPDASSFGSLKRYAGWRKLKHDVLSHLPSTMVSQFACCINGQTGLDQRIKVLPASHICVLDVQAAAADIDPHLSRVRDATLRHLLSSGVAFLHATMTPAEQEVVTLLFNSGAIQVGTSLLTQRPASSLPLVTIEICTFCSFLGRAVEATTMVYSCNPAIWTRHTFEWQAAAFHVHHLVLSCGTATRSLYVLLC